MSNPNKSTLLCTICPKNPRFSDVSHLLTHMSSKSHLSHRFKIELRSKSEIAAKMQLDEFDNWYHQNNLDARLAERMAAKDDKKLAKGKKIKKAPKVERAPLKPEIDPFFQTPLASPPIFRAPMPRMHLWPTTFTSASSPTPVGDDTQSTTYGSPTLRCEVPNFSQKDAPGAFVQDTPGTRVLDQKLTTPWKLDSDRDGNSPEKLSDSAKLKGVYWPGMDLFDSATPQMKRKRNQRKDGSILEHMMATSAQVEPLEISYFPSGEQRDAKDIFGPLSCENSPVKAPRAVKKRKPRKPLKDLNVNLPYLPAPQLRGDDLAGSPVKSEHPIMQQNLVSLQRPIPTLNPLAGIHGFVPTRDEEEEFKMTVGNMGNFTIFQDEPEDSPGRTESPLAEYDFNSPSLPAQSSKRVSMNHNWPTPIVQYSPKRIYGGKENQQPEHQIPVRRPLSVLPSQVLHEPMINPLFNQAHARSSTFGSHQFGFGGDFRPFNGILSPFHGEFRPLGPPFRGMGGPNMTGGSGNGMQFRM